MTQTSIFLPMIGMAFLTFTVLGLIPIRRFAAVGKGHVGPDDFKLGESAAVPAGVALPNRNYMNLLELPVLFYAVCLALFVSGMVDSMTLRLAWAYVALRVVHSLIHLTSNNVIQRLTAFAFSNFVLMAIWVLFAIKLVAQRG